MKTSITRAPGSGTMRSGCLRATGLALAIACLFGAQPLQAEQAHRGGAQHSERRAPHQAVRHDDHRRGGYGYSNGYGNQSYGYGYNAPPIVYAPGAAPGISLFLPL